MRLFNLLAKLVSGEKQNGDKDYFESDINVQDMQKAVLAAVTVLLEYGVFDQENLSGRIQSFLMDALTYGNHMHDAVAEAVSAMLFSNKYLLQSCIRNAININSQKICLAYLDALTKNFERYLVDWMGACSAETILAICLCHLCSPLPYARHLATRMANVLTSYGNTLNVGYVLPDTSASTRNTYISIPLKYSTEISRRNKSFTPNIIRDFMGFMDMMPDDYCRLLLMMVRPWLVNLSWIVAREKKILAGVAIVEDLFNMSRKFSLKYPEMVSRMWVAACSAKDDAEGVEPDVTYSKAEVQATIGLVIDGLLKKYVASTDGSPLSTKLNPTMEVCHLIVGTLSSTPYIEELLTSLCNSLRHVKPTAVAGTEMDTFIALQLEDSKMHEKVDSRHAAGTAPSALAKLSDSSNALSAGPGESPKQQDYGTLSKKKRKPSMIVEEPALTSSGSSSDPYDTQAMPKSSQLHLVKGKFQYYQLGTDDVPASFTAREIAAFTLCSDVILNAGTRVASHLPLLLHHAYVLFRGTRQFSIFMKNVLRSAAQNQPTGEHFMNINQMLNKVAKIGCTGAFISDVIQLLNDLHDVDIGMEWAILALDWAVGSDEALVRHTSLQLFSFINSDLSLTTLRKIAILTMNATYICDDLAFDMCWDAIDEIAKNVDNTEPKCLYFLSVLCGAQLSTASVLQFGRALRVLHVLLKKDFMRESKASPRMSVLGTNIMQALCSTWHNEKEMTLSLLRGVCHPDTRQASCSVLWTISTQRSYGVALPAGKSSTPYLVIASLLVETIRAMEGEDAYAELSRSLSHPQAAESPVLKGFLDVMQSEKLVGYDAYHRGNFFQRFAEQFANSFGTPSCLQFTTAVLTIFLRLTTSRREKAVTLELLVSLVLAFEKNRIHASITQYLQEVGRYFMFAKDKELSNAAVKLISFSARHLPMINIIESTGDSVKTVEYNFLRSSPSENIYSGQNKQFFTGEDKKTALMYTYRTLLQCHSILLGLPATSQTAHVLKESVQDFVTDDDFEKHLKLVGTPVNWWLLVLSSADGSSTGSGSGSGSGGGGGSGIAGSGSSDLPPSRTSRAPSRISRSLGKVIAE